MMEELAALFTTFQQDGHVQLTYETKVYARRIGDRANAPSRLA
jgi:hypothetical protein